MRTKDLDRDGGVVSAQRAREFAEVLTPRWVVEKMLDEIPGASDPHKTVFDPGCGRDAYRANRLSARQRNGCATG